jgi:hypothetical protein
MVSSRKPAFVVLAGILASLPQTATAWGCDGHELVALVAQKHMNPRAQKEAEELLQQNPIDPSLKRYCSTRSTDPFVDSATWADDYRDVDKSTGDWHYLDIPLGADDSNPDQFCPAAGCVTKAITDQVAILKSSDADSQKRAMALRFVIHFTGDLHQPLHVVTNTDRGGNCVPVAYFTRKPKADGHGGYSPNLHHVWDTEIVQRMMGKRSLEQVASDLDGAFKSRASTWQAGGIDLAAWAQETHGLAVDIAYGKLPVMVHVEEVQPIKTCTDDDDIGQRMLALDETIGKSYEASAELTVKRQLARAGVRLALILNDVWPEAK